MMEMSNARLAKLEEKAKIGATLVAKGAGALWALTSKIDDLVKRQDKLTARQEVLFNRTDDLHDKALNAEGRLNVLKIELDAAGPKLGHLVERIAWLSEQMEQIVGVKTFDEWQDDQKAQDEPCDCCEPACSGVAISLPEQQTYVVHGYQVVPYAPSTLPGVALLYAGPNLALAEAVAMQNSRMSHPNGTYTYTTLNVCDAEGRPVSEFRR